MSGLRGPLARTLTGFRGALAKRDPGLHATRRAGRAAIFVPLLLWFGKDVLDDPVLGVFAALGSVGMLVFVNFTGPMRERVFAQAMLAICGGALICLGTLTSTVTWLAAVATLLIVFAIIFAGIFSSLLAGASTVLVISFVLSATLAAPAEAIPDRLLGWLLAGGVSILAVRLLWPAPVREPLRTLASETCRRFAAQLHCESECIEERSGPAAIARLEQLRGESANAAAELRASFFATPYRPGGISTSSRALVRATDELIWLDRVFARAPLTEPAPHSSAAICALTTTGAELLEHCADLLMAGEGDLDHLDRDLERLRQTRERMETAITSISPAENSSATANNAAPEDAIGLVSSLQPSFRAQEISFIVAAVAANVHRGVAAVQRSWSGHLFGGEPREPQQRGQALAHGSAWSSVKQRTRAHLTPGSVWLHNSLRGALALACAVLIAKLSNVQHGFWLVFGSLAVLRTNALSTGQDAVRAVSGTVVGIALGGGLVALLGAESAVSWLVLVPAVALIALGPVVFNFAVGQIGFTTTLLLLNNIVTPAGWSAGLVRLEDVGIGCAVSVAVGALFWPRGAGRALGTALAEAFSTAAGYLQGAVEYGLGRCDAQVPTVATPQPQAAAASAAGRRLDDAFRAYVAERGTKRLPLADVALLVGGASLLRLTADAIIDVWERDDRAIGGDRAAAREELNAATTSIGDWYAQAARSFAGEGPPPALIDGDEAADARLIQIVRRDLRNHDAQASGTAVKMIWTADHIDAARRLQAEIAEPGARAAMQWQ
jgi:uncharacterized membrane protein YccC